MKTKENQTYLKCMSKFLLFVLNTVIQKFDHVRAETQFFLKRGLSFNETLEPKYRHKTGSTTHKIKAENLSFLRFLNFSKIKTVNNAISVSIFGKYAKHCFR